MVELRARIHAAEEGVPADELDALLKQADSQIKQVHFYGDLVLLAFFKGRKSSEREHERRKHATYVMSDQADRYRDEIEEWGNAQPPFTPFHWEIQFPEVFERENPGFDAIVGNPPFAGKNTAKAANVAHYPDWLKQAHPESHGNSDLVAHFFRRAFTLVRASGTFGLIATNTIAQGDTRATGLRWICTHGGTIYKATRRYRWPGQAAVIVSVVHVHRGPWVGTRFLDGAETAEITAFLCHSGGHDDPARLAANAGKSFQGSIVLGMGFTFDDTDTKGVATKLGEMRRLITEKPRNREVIFPYLGGEEVNTSPTHAHHRYVINFQDWPLRRGDVGESWAGADGQRRRELRRRPVVPLDYSGPVATDWPELLAIVEERVKPERLAQNDKGGRRQWWQYLRPRPELRATIAELERVLVISRVGQHAAFTFLPNDMVYSESMIALPLTTYAAFSALQSRPHEIWARLFGSSMKDDLRYTPSDCFATFPFPEDWETHADLEAAGKAYYEFRADLMVRNDEGMTTIYNRFHDCDEGDPDIVRLRDLHAAMDHAVLNAYGWGRIPVRLEFLPDYAINEEEWGRRKKPHRYRWPDEIRDEVLARLLALNAQRAETERAASGA